ncbi:MAG TPA: pyridoxal-dependent decarboxylase, partial [Blastocatellia bacterium]|nr:pyridoxal-dependent decarboxylase [Blastocatellia bacterium]
MQKTDLVTTRASRAEESLDPVDPAAWEEMRALAHRMVDDMMGYLETVRERSVWQPVPHAVRARFESPVPREGEGAEAAYRDFVRDVLPYPVGNIHPRFWGWVNGTGTPLGMLADMLAAGMNPNVGGFDQSAIYVETQVLDWFKQLLGFPGGSSGILVSGGSMANFVGLAVARNSRAGSDVAREGVLAGGRQMVAYGSRETHSSIQKAVELIGVGSNFLRRIPVNGDYEIDVDALRGAISEDRARGLAPFCVIGNAGTVNTGAIDDLSALAQICEEEGLWFHIDGAFGAFAALSPANRPRLSGMERADSLAFDLHKWMYIPYEAGCTLVRDGELHRAAFAATGAYLSPTARGVASGPVWFGELGVQLSRGFRALKIWLSIKEHGSEKYRRLIEQNIEQARYLAALVEAEPELELLAPVPLNVVCFRYSAAGG